MPAPLSVMMILPLLGTVDTGVSVTVMDTDVAPRTTLLRVIAGAKVPRDVPGRIAGYVPVTLDPTMVVPSFQVVAAATSVISAWPAVGLVKPNPVMVNVMAWPPDVPVVKVNETVKTNGPVPLREAVPHDGDEPLPGWAIRAEHCTLVLLAKAMPAPLSVMMILPLLGTGDTGVSATVMETDVAPRALLLRVITGAEVPRDVPARMTKAVSADSGKTQLRGFEGWQQALTLSRDNGVRVNCSAADAIRNAPSTTSILFI
jgi:hypothetical protein